MLAVLLSILASCGFPTGRASTVLGSGTSALLGGDLTDPENDGVDGTGANFNWVSISASSENAWSNEGAFNVFDNKVGSGDDKWCCEDAPQWIAVEFDRPFVLTTFTIAAGNDAPERDPTRWSIEGSNDGANWTPIYSWNDGVSIFGPRLEVIRFDGADVDFPAPPPYKRFRYHALTTGGPLHQVNELEFFGIATIVIRDFKAAPPVIPAGASVTLSWEVDPATTSVTLDGVGDVTARTVGGIGSIMIDPGPATTTVYRLAAVHPDTTAQQTATVTVTDQPIISHFAATPATIGPGENSTLSWEVFNAAQLILNGADVTGTTSLAVTPASTTTYTLEAANAQGSATAAAVISVVEPGVPRISEFMASNDGAALVDEDGEASDWIEIHNPSGADARLAGYHLTDDPNNLTKWTFPDVTLGPDQYLIVFASGKDRTTPGGELHASFSLDADGEYLALVKPDGSTIVSEFGANGSFYPGQEAGVSFGLFGEPPQSGFFNTATPGGANSSGFLGFVRDTKFSVNRGFFSSPQTLAITTATPGAAIRYTTDGSEPGEATGTIYTAPIAIDRTMPVRAIAYKPGHRPTNVDTHTYIFPADVVAQSAANTQSVWKLPASWGSQSPDYGMDGRVTALHDATIRDDLKTVPTLSIVMDSAEMFGQGGIYANPNSSGDAWERAMSLELIDPASPGGGGDFQLNGGIRIQGGAFRSFGLTLKKSFRVVFKGRYGATKLRFPLFGADAAKEFDTLILRMESNDGYQWDNRTNVQYARDEFGRRTALDMGIPSSRGRFLHLYINGVYWGLYNAVERPDAAFGEAYFGAKKEEWDGINFGTPTNGGSTASYNTMLSLLSPISTSATEPERTAAYMRAQGRNPDGTDNPGLADFIDVDNYIDYLLANWFTGNNDWPHRNYYTGRERDLLDPVPRKGSRVSIGTHFFMWDVETSMGLNSSNDKTGTTSGVAAAYGHLRNSLEFRVRFGDHAFQALFNDGPLTPQRCLDRYAEITRDHSSILIPELARWGDQHGVLRTLQQWQTEYNAVRSNWLAVRTPGLIGILQGAGLYPRTDAPSFSQRGGSVSPATPVTMATNADRIYYTTDGSDPRLLGGAPNPNASAAVFGGGGPVPVTYMDTGFVWKYLDNGSDQGSAWRATAFDDSDWASGPSSLGYGTDGEGAGTTVGFGPNAGSRYATTYFRTTVAIPEPGQFASFLLQLKYDDAAAVYLNGAEIVRTPNLPANAAFGDYATSAIADEASWKSFTIPSSAFVPGGNTITVEIHQASGGSSDIRMDMFLRGEVTNGGGSNVSDPIHFAQPAVLSARSFNSSTGEWSALNQAFFSVDSVPASSANLVVSEFSYRPRVPASAGELQVSSDRDDYEFIELMNIGAQTIDLTGVRFTSGIQFGFVPNTLLDPGQRIVVAKSIPAFSQRYPGLAGGTVVAGPFESGSLAGGGERIAIESAGGDVIRSFTYSNLPPWPASADGDGYSLLLIAPRTNPSHDLGSNWRSSSGLDGNPGGADSETYAQWKSARGIIDDAGDPDFDGLNNFGEFAMGTSFDAGGAAHRLETGVMTIDGERHAIVKVRRNLRAADEVALVVETSTGLASWSADAVYVGEVNNGDGLTSTVTYRSPEPIEATPSLHFRARFSER